MELDHMHTVILGMDERILDVGDSFSQLHVHVELWLIQHVGSENESWFRAYDADLGYCVRFVSESDALKFTLSWL
jgi:hypothetical protein